MPGTSYLFVLCLYLLFLSASSQNSKLTCLSSYHANKNVTLEVTLSLQDFGVCDVYPKNMEILITRVDQNAERLCRRSINCSSVPNEQSCMCTGSSQNEITFKVEYSPGKQDENANITANVDCVVFPGKPDREAFIIPGKGCSNIKIVTGTGSSGCDWICIALIIGFVFAAICICCLTYGFCWCHCIAFCRCNHDMKLPVDLGKDTDPNKLEQLAKELKTSDADLKQLAEEAKLCKCTGNVSISVGGNGSSDSSGNVERGSKDQLHVEVKSTSIFDTWRAKKKINEKLKEIVRKVKADG